MNKSVGTKIAVVAGVAVLAIVAFVARGTRRTEDSGAAAEPARESDRALPRLVDLGSKTCIPCKMMEPVLDELATEYAGRLSVEFIDVKADPEAGRRYRISVIPTQIWFDASGKELMRHEGFIPKADILATFHDHGVDFGGQTAQALPDIVREEPLEKDSRPPEAKCLMCERDVDPKAKVVVKSSTGNLTHLCSPHCYFIMESCLLDKSSMAEVAATDFSSGAPVPFAQAAWLYGADEGGRPTIKAFASRERAQAQMRASGGSVLTLDAMREKEYSVRCGFCDRAMYTQDNGSTVQVVGGPKTYGCCPHCALGVAARLGKDIVVENHDPVSGALIHIETFDGRVKALDPSTAVAWFGQKRKSDGSFGSAGCFHQWNFENPESLKKWIDSHPMETGRIYPIAKALEDKMKLSPEQIKKACKVGECK
jgi:thioredoxin 1